jgi:hypothetical protein
MPYGLRKSPKKELYWVFNKETGHKFSKLPLPKQRAQAQIRAIYASERIRAGSKSPKKKSLKKKSPSKKSPRAVSSRFYFEKQKSLKCAIHALNNIVRNDPQSAFRRSFKVIDGRDSGNDKTFNIKKICEELKKTELEKYKHLSKREYRKKEKSFECKSSGDYNYDVVEEVIKKMGLTIEELTQLRDGDINGFKTFGEMTPNFLGFFVQQAAHYVAVLVRENKVWLLDSLNNKEKELKSVKDLGQINLIWGIIDEDEERTDEEN